MGRRLWFGDVFSCADLTKCITVQLGVIGALTLELLHHQLCLGYLIFWQVLTLALPPPAVEKSTLADAMSGVLRQACDCAVTFIRILYFSWKAVSSFSFSLVCFSRLVAICSSDQSDLKARLCTCRAGQ